MNILNLIIFIVLAWNVIASLVFKRSNVLYCGLVGFSGVNNANVDKLKQLLLANILRGDKGTGFYDGTGIHKNNSNAVEFLSKTPIAQTKLFIGHTRQPTTGFAATVANCHPFEYNDTITVHNGTLESLWTLAQTYNIKAADYDTDSQLLAQCLSLDNGFDVLSRLNGTASIIFHKKDTPDILYCFRKDDKRPLFRGYIDNDMYLSSIKESLELIGCFKIKEFKTMVLYKIQNGKIIESKIRKQLVQPATTTTVTRGTSGNFSGYSISGFAINDVVCYGDSITKKQPLELYCVKSNCNDTIILHPITKFDIPLDKEQVKVHMDTKVYRYVQDTAAACGKLKKVNINSSITYRKNDVAVLLINATQEFKDTAGNKSVIECKRGELCLCLSDVDADGLIYIMFLNSHGLTAMHAPAYWLGYYSLTYAEKNELFNALSINMHAKTASLCANKQYDSHAKLPVEAQSIITEIEQAETVDTAEENETDEGTWLSDDDLILDEVLAQEEFFTCIFDLSGKNCGDMIREYRKLLVRFMDVVEGVSPILKEADKDQAFKIKVALASMKAEFHNMHHALKDLSEDIVLYLDSK